MLSGYIHRLCFLLALGIRIPLVRDALRDSRDGHVILVEASDDVRVGLIPNPPTVYVKPACKQLPIRADDRPRRRR